MKREFIYKPVSVSTNTELKAMIRASAAPVTAVLQAGEQTGGRGRQNKSFFSPPGGVYFSAAYPLTGAETDVPFFTLLAGLAVCRALESMSPAEYRVKWPNDIYVNGKKICGILTELVSDGRRNTAVVGVGINVSLTREEIPLPLGDTVTSLAAEGLKKPSPAALINSAVALLDHYVYDLGGLCGNTAAFAEALNARSYLTGKTVTVDTGGEKVTGRVKEISPAGRLVLETNRGAREIFSGTVIL